MNKRMFKQGLITVVLLGVIGVVGARAYHSHESAERVAPTESAPKAEATPASGVDLRDPWAVMHADMVRMQTQMDQIYRAAFGESRTVGSNDQPANARATLDEQEDNYVVKADIPGASESDVNVNLDGRLLSISSRSHGAGQQTTDDGQVIRQNSYARSFQQVFTLPGPVNASGMQTQFQDGVLKVTIPKVTS
jgi:HSP20 family molecular chaperone IbpA